MFYIVIYLVAIIAANLSVAYFGASAVIVNAFLFIGLDLTARDKLHQQWQNDNLILKMFFLILSGSVLSWLLNHDAGIIAVASFSAFALAAITDSIVYHALKDKSYTLRVNGSNLPSALVDSLVFPFIAFGGFLPSIVVGQFVAKVAGGFVWSLILRKVQ